MARIQVLPLPKTDSASPFILVFDQLGDDATEALVRDIGLSEAKKATGAAGIMIFPFRMDVA